MAIDDFELELEVPCPFCFLSHIFRARYDDYGLGENTAPDRCPHCGEYLYLVYDVRPHVRLVRASDKKFPVLMPLGAQA